jgi:putative transposase
METVRIIKLEKLPACTKSRIRDAQQESSKVWEYCRKRHFEARKNRTKWPTQGELQKETKGIAKIHSNSIQMVTHAFLANVDTCRKVRQSHPKMKMEYPHKEKEFYPVLWPKQALKLEKRKLILPMGRGRPPLRFRINWEDPMGGAKFVWNCGAYELHISRPADQKLRQEADIKATVDLGEIHTAAVTTSTGLWLC